MKLKSEIDKESTLDITDSTKKAREMDERKVKKIILNRDIKI